MGGAKKPLELMTEEELEAQYRRDVLAAAMAIKVNGNPVRLEDNANVRNVPVVDDLHAGSSGGGMPEVPAAGGPVEVALPTPGQEPVLRGVAPQ
jgi:hypothetical protein